MSFLSNVFKGVSSVASVATSFLGASNPLTAGIGLLMGGLGGKGGFDIGSLISPITKGLSDVFSGLFGQPQVNQFQQNLGSMFGGVLQPQAALAGIPNGSSIEDRLVGVSNGLESQLDGLIGKLSADMKPEDLAKVQAQIQKITRMLDMVSNIMKSVNDSQKNIVQNIR